MEIPDGGGILLPSGPIGIEFAPLWSGANSMQEKKCPRCEHPKPVVEFNKDSRTKDGLDSYCKFHRSEINRANHSKNKGTINERHRCNREGYKEKYRPVTEGTKFCPDCGSEREVREFSPNPYRPDGLREVCKFHQNQRYAKDRYAVLVRYSSDPPCCARCGETAPKLLSLDHINGGGIKHRKKVGFGNAFLLWLKQNDYPADFRVLCHSCNQVESAKNRRQELLDLRSETTKVCTKCKTERFTAQFSKENRSSDGLNWKCKICFAEEYDEVRLECLRHYSDGDPSCMCCGKTEIEALCLDHIDGRSEELRAAMKNYPQYVWIKRNGFPEGLRVLCHSCNQSRQYYGKCPHEKD